MKSGAEIRSIYRSHFDAIFDKRFASPFPLRRYAHRVEYESVLAEIKPGQKVLDVGCGDGTFALLAAKRGIDITGVDLSEENIRHAQDRAEAEGLGASFVVGDAERVPFSDASFDVVVSLQVLEHLPDFRQGLLELGRLTKSRAIISIPTCLNGCALVQLGGGMFWRKRPLDFAALALGAGRVTLALATLRIGVNEGYASHKDIPHYWRFPWVFRRELRRAGFRIVKFEASTLCLPHFASLLPLIKRLDAHKAAPVLRELGYGTIAVVDKAA